jgi:DNA-binding SARP family transcriptional activator
VGRTVEIRVLGAPAVFRSGVAVPLPRSRKVRALLAFLALSPQPVTRSRLCDLLWDVPNDPRGELRWCLSKLRAVLDGDRRRVITEGDTVSLDLSDCRVDARELEVDVAKLDTARLVELCDLVGGELLDGVDIDCAELAGWLAAQRNRYRMLQIDLLRELASRSQGAETLARLESWLRIAPFDPRAHEVLVQTLVKSGRLRDAEDHVARTIRAFEEEGLDWTPVREALRRDAPKIEVAQPKPSERRRRAAIAVMPFTGDRAADGLTEDIIMQLAKLRVLFVIARGTMYALRERGVEAREVGRILEVDYVASGTVRRDGDRVTVSVELIDTHDGRIVWTDSLRDDTFTVLDAIVDRIVAAIAEEIELAECQRALLAPPSTLDAWEAYHRGLWHMYKFNGTDNPLAEHFFRTALQLDPMFARAHSGLSFTHFQNAFLDLTPDRNHQIDLAYEAACQSVAADGHDPAAHWAMGRALWLRGSDDESVIELGRSVELSPNFALGHYTLGFVLSQAGDPRAAIAASSRSRELSPFDPLQFGMLASRAVAHIRLDEFQEAAEWSVKATTRPNAHAHILAIAVESLALANRNDEARKFVARIRERIPSYTIENFLRAFRFPGDIQNLLRSAARRIDF